LTKISQCMGTLMSNGHFLEFHGLTEQSELGALFRR
jgi:hypothetical protein